MIETSIIIPFWGKPQYLIKCLESLVKQTEKNIEIIVVSDGSREISNIKSQVSNILKDFEHQFLTQNHKGSGAARNLGVGKARGKILVFVDADMTFEKNFIKNLIKPIKEGKTKGTFSRDEYVANWNNVWARCWNYNLGLGTKRKIPERYPNQSPVFRAILKTEFIKAEGFDNTGYMDDWTLSQKLGYKSEVAEKTIYYHYNPSSLKEVFYQSKWRVKRKYKFGILGEMIYLLLYFLPISLVKGLVGAIYWREIKFIIFTIVFDWGSFLGLLEKNIFKNYY